MNRRASLGLLSLSLFLLAFPLVVGKPGLPPTLKSDEPAYYLMALSLARDGDLRVEGGDLERAFEDFPYRPISNLILMSDDGWETIHYGKPYVYSLFAAPFAGLFGANGLLFFNMSLTVAMVWMGFWYLRRWNPEGPAALFSAGFFLLSAGFAYVFWLHPEVFNMAAVAACLFFGLRPGPDSGGSRGRREVLVAALSGAALALAVYNKPMIAAVALAPLLASGLRRRWAEAGAWLAGAALTLAAVAGLATALTGHPTPYLGVERQGVVLCSPDEIPIDRETAATAEAGAEERPTGGAWSWIFRVPEVQPKRFLENLIYFLVGRHTGLFLYFPFAVLALVLFLVHRRRSPWRWGLIAGLGAVALFFLLFIPANWQGGGGFVGNRYFVNVYPGFLFLVTRIRPLWTLPAGFAAGGLFLGTIVFTPFGAAVPEPTLQTHVRNPPFGLFPLELTLREVPGYHRRPLGSMQVMARKDVTLPRGGAFWVAGGVPVELFFLAPEPLDEPVHFLVRSPAPDNRIRLRMGADERSIELGRGTAAGSQSVVTLEPSGPDRFTHRGEPIPVYRLEVSAERSRIQSWTRQFPPARCPGSGFAYYETLEDNFPVGAEVIFLGTGDVLDRDVFAVEWGSVEMRRRVLPGQTFYAEVELTNASDEPWQPGVGAEVRLSYHWYTPRGELVAYDGLRTDLPLPVAPGETVDVAQEIVAPAEPGRYVLVLDPLVEHVSWFSRRGVEPYRAEITVVASEAGGPSDGGAGPETDAP